MDVGLRCSVMRLGAAGVLLATAAAIFGAPAGGGAGREVAPADREFLLDLERRSVLYFWEQADPNTGLILDRARVDGAPAKGPSRNVASIAATGFGLTALCIGAEHGWIPQESAAERVRTTLRFLAARAPSEHGWFFHWMDVNSGQSRWDSETSSIDTAFLVAGALTAAHYFSNDREIPVLAKRIYDQVDFQWMLNGDPFLLSHGWKPGKGFLRYKWDTYSELSLLYLLAIGSRTHPIGPQSWYTWTRPFYTYGQYQFISGGPLFTHQYSHAWVDFRGRRDRGFIDFFENSVSATRANQLFCQRLRDTFPLSFGPQSWGVTASDSMKGYKIYGEIAEFEPIDGTVAPCAPAGSLMFTPDISIPALRGMRTRFDEQVYGRYGFVDAFNPGAGWFDSDVIGIDAGISLLSSENLLTGNVWRWFMSNDAAPRAMELLGFSSPPSTASTPLTGSHPARPVRHTSRHKRARHRPAAASATKAVSATK